jgi:hypothetical protein
MPPDKFLHRPWKALSDTLAKATSRPIVDHDSTRQRAVEALKTVQK